MTPSPTLQDRLKSAATWLAAGWIAWEFGFYLQYKLPGHPGSVELFTILSDWLGTPGGEAPFRLFVAFMEIAAGILVLIPRTRSFGAAFSLGIMSGAIFFHVVSPLGIDPYGDGGRLFKEAVLTWFLAGFILLVNRAEVMRFVVALRALLLPAAA